MSGAQACSEVLQAHARCLQWWIAPLARWWSEALQCAGLCWLSGCQDNALRRILPPARNASPPCVAASLTRRGRCFRHVISASKASLSTIVSCGSHGLIAQRMPGSVLPYFSFSHWLTSSVVGIIFVLIVFYAKVTLLFLIFFGKVTEKREKNKTNSSVFFLPSAKEFPCKAKKFALEAHSRG